MKWKDLSLKERKQIYDSVRANNPDATYFDIKEQFDSIPTYEDGKGKTINKADLPPEYRTGTPEYFERQKKVGRAIEGTDAYTAESYAEPFTPTITKKKKGKKVKTESENKAHMIQLKRGMQKEGLINNWTDPITQDKIEEYLSYRSKYANRVNPVLRTLYDIRPDKQGFINRMNNLTPIEWAVPLGLPMFFGEEQENK